MPKHLLGFFILTGAINRPPTVVSPHLGQIIRSFKAACTVVVRRCGFVKNEPLWQRNYYEHVIRSESSLAAIREYVENNPTQWELDRENPRFRAR
jgi:REP element-mobilizing transposase RayT